MRRPQLIDIQRYFLVAAWMALETLRCPAAPGMIGHASDGSRSVTFIAPTPSFTLGADESIHPQLTPKFKVEWSGKINILRNGNYTLTGSGEILVDGEKVKGRQVQLTAGEHELRIEFQRSAGPVRSQLEWESDFFPREPVPARLLSHTTVPELTQAAKLERGRQLVENLNCTACHEGGGKLLAGRRAPDLSRVGDRVTTSWIADWLENPRHYRADSVMPVLLTNAQDRTDVAAYLTNLRSERPLPPVAPGNAATGQSLANTIGCVACHDESRSPLARVESKYANSPALARYLADPLTIDASGRMPDQGLSRSEAADIAAYLMRSHKADAEKPPPNGDPLRGRTIVAAVGCANCHAITDTQGTIRPHVAARSLDGANPGRGCLADSPQAPAPNYNLSTDDRAALRAFVQSPDVSPAPVQDFQRMATALQCNACHELNSPARLRPEPAPPSLTDSGNKLRASWLEEVLLKHKRVRPWMTLRMPNYGAAVTPLINGFASQAGAELGEGLAPPTPTKEQVEAGIKLIGSAEGGLSCINCHDFKGEPSPGQMRGPDLTEMTARVRTDWMRRWLREPARIQEGTAMPAFFTEMPAASATMIIEQLVQALAAGKDMPTPPGWGAALNSYIVAVADEPVLVRTFMPNSSPRSIAVGLPGGQSYCFDAAFALLRYAWRGEFLDAKGAWADRGGQVSTPLGQPWFNSPQTHPLRIGNPGTEPQVRFRGYQLDKEVPVFRYELNGTPVTERITATKDGRGLVREFTITNPTGEITVLDPNVPGAMATTSLGEFVNGLLRVPSSATVRFTLTLIPK